MWNFLRRSRIALVLVSAISCVVLGYFFIFFESCDEAPADPEYQEILKEFSASQPIAVSVSPNGEYVLTKAQIETGGFQIFVQETDSSRLVFSNFSQNSQRSLTWRPDSKAIAFQEIEGMERPLYFWDLKKQMKQKVNVPVSKTALPPLRWDPAGRKLAYFHGDWRKGDLLLISEDGSTVTIEQSLSGTCNYVWAPDGSRLAVCSTSKPGLVRIVKTDGSLAKEIHLGGNASVKSLSWSPDGQFLLAAARRDANEYFQAFELDTDTGKVSIRSSTEADIQDPIWLPDGKSFIYHVLSDGLVRIVRQDQGSSQSKVIGPTNGVLSASHFAPDSNKLYARYASLTHPPSLIAISMVDGDTGLLYAPPQSIESRCSIPQSIRIKAADKTLIPAYHWKNGVTDKPSAVVIEVHGGLHTQTFPTWESHIPVLAKRGFDFIAVNYRGSSGFGRSFEEAGDEEDRVMDVIAARDHAVNTLGFPPSQVYLMGNSRGSTLIAMAAARGIQIGGLVLISWAGGTKDVQADVHTPFKVLGFQGELDPFVSTKEAQSDLKLLFGHSDLVEMAWYTYCKEGHFFYRADSWAKICWRLHQTSRQGAHNNLLNQ